MLYRVLLIFLGNFWDVLGEEKKGGGAGFLKLRKIKNLKDLNLESQVNS